MDYIFRYPLNKAHYYERQAEFKEILGQYYSAQKLRESSLENLKTALSLTSNDVIQSNIDLQIIHEEKQIDRLSKLSTDVQLKKRGKALDFQTIMAESNVPNVSKNIEKILSSPQKSQSNYKAYILDIVHNTEMINRLALGIESKIKIATGANPLPDEIASNSTAPTSDVQSEGSNASNKQETLLMLEQLKDYNSKNLLLTTNIIKEFSLLQMENSNLITKVDALTPSPLESPERKVSNAKEEKSPSPFVLYPMGENYISSPLSVEDFAPLECPPMDFLKAKQDSSQPSTPL